MSGDETQPYIDYVSCFAKVLNILKQTVHRFITTLGMTKVEGYFLTMFNLYISMGGLAIKNYKLGELIK